MLLLPRDQPGGGKWLDVSRLLIHPFAEGTANKASAFFRQLQIHHFSNPNSSAKAKQIGWSSMTLSVHNISAHSQGLAHDDHQTRYQSCLCHQMIQPLRPRIFSSLTFLILLIWKLLSIENLFGNQSLLIIEKGRFWDYRQLLGKVALLTLALLRVATLIKAIAKHAEHRFKRDVILFL